MEAKLSTFQFQGIKNNKKASAYFYYTVIDSFKCFFGK